MNRYREVLGRKKAFARWRTAKGNWIRYKIDHHYNDYEFCDACGKRSVGYRNQPVRLAFFEACEECLAVFIDDLRELIEEVTENEH